jgi:hypothetical protein
MTKMRICSTEKGRDESREEKRRGEKKASCAFTAVCTLFHQEDTLFRRRRDSAEVVTKCFYCRKHSSFSHDLSKRQSDLPPSSHPLEMPRHDRPFGVED